MSQELPPDAWLKGFHEVPLSEETIAWATRIIEERGTKEYQKLARVLWPGIFGEKYVPNPDDKIPLHWMDMREKEYGK